MEPPQGENNEPKNGFININDLLDDPPALLTIPEYRAVEAQMVPRRRKRKQRAKAQKIDRDKRG